MAPVRHASGPGLVCWQAFRRQSGCLLGREVDDGERGSHASIVVSTRARFRFQFSFPTMRLSEVMGLVSLWHVSLRSHPEVGPWFRPRTYPKNQHQEFVFIRVSWPQSAHNPWDGCSSLLVSGCGVGACPSRILPRHLDYVGIPRHVRGKGIRSADQIRVQVGTCELLP